MYQMATVAMAQAASAIGTITRENPQTWVLKARKTMTDRLGVGTFHQKCEFVLKRGRDGILVAGAHVAVATVNDSATARRLSAMGAQGVMTDTIGLLVENPAL